MPLIPLPLELWRLIFLFATRRDLSSRTSVDVARHYFAIPPRKSLRSSGVYSQWLQTKLSLILVCKAWHQISIEFLLEDIYIGNAAQYLSLASMLDNSVTAYERQKSGLIEHSLFSRTHLASCVRALEIEIGRWWDELPLHRQESKGLLSYCQNLRMLRVYTSLGGANDVKFWYPKEMPQHLRYCQIPWDHFNSSLCPGSNLLQGFDIHGVLEVLRLLVWSSGDFPDLSLSLPRLHTLRLYAGSHDQSDIVMSRLATWSLPAFRIFSSTFSSNNSPSHAAFFSAHGSAMKILEIEGGSADLLPIAIARCPMLESLSLNAIFFCQPLPPLARLRHLGLDVSNVNISLLEEVFNNVSNVHVGVTSIQLDWMIASEFTRLVKLQNLLDQWERWDDICSRRNIRFEDWEGKLIQFADHDLRWEEIALEM